MRGLNEIITANAATSQMKPQGENGMSKKHFEALAAQIALIEDIKARLDAAEAVAKVCQQFNSCFDSTRFFLACGIDIRSAK